jgi:hypothetical protein
MGEVVSRHNNHCWMGQHLLQGHRVPGPRRGGAMEGVALAELASRTIRSIPATKLKRGS